MRFAQGHFYVPFEKVDRERRMVWGIAQTEEPDTQGDLLTYEASLDAFQKWEKNVREMHDPKAVGRAVKVIADPVNRCIYVGTYISKGAEDTWQKVLDGTLRGYSIGGGVLEATREFSKRLGRNVRKVTKYVLDELSLVDSPANQSCVITAVQKRADNTLVATDVLGRMPTTLVAGDVLSFTGASMSKRLTKRAKMQSLVPFVQKLDEKDEVIVARISDFQKSKDGSFVLRPDAAIAKLTKGELDADGYSDPADEQPAADVPEIDFGGHAENAANLHHDLCKMAGVDPFEHYEQSVREDEPEGGEPGDEGAGEPGEMGKSRGFRRGKRALAKRGAADLDKRISAAVGDKLNVVDTLAKSVDALKGQIETLGSGIAARKEGAAGEPVTKGAGTSEPTTELEEVQAELAKARGTAKDLLLKGDPKDSSERAAREQLAKRISQLEVRESHLKRATR